MFRDITDLYHTETELPWIKLKGSLDHEDHDLIYGLQLQIHHHDQISSKLELDYKLAGTIDRTDKTSICDINEFMYFDGKQLIGYIGICSFTGQGALLEITGMVHPEYRCKGVFSRLHEFVIAECRRRNAGSVLVLCDRESVPGREFLAKIGAVYQSSEFEMVFNPEHRPIAFEQQCGIHFRKAANADVHEIARQNVFYFGGWDEQER